MAAAAPVNPLLREVEEGRRRTGPFRAVLVVALCLTVGQALAYVVQRVSDIDGDSHGGESLLNVIAFAPTAALLALWVVRWERRPLLSLGFRGTHRARRVGLGVATALLGLLLLNVVLSALHGSDGDDGGSGPSSTALSLAVLLATFAVQAPTEEMLFRGYLLPVFSNRWGVAAGVLLSSALFGLAHLVNPGTSPVYALLTFLLGVALSLWALADGNLWRAAAFHTVWNWAPTAFASGDGDNGSRDAAALDGSTMAAVVFVLVLVGLSALWSYRRSLRRESAS